MLTAFKKKGRSLLRRLAGPSEVDPFPSIDFMSGLRDSSWVLYGLVRALKPDVCVEIGSARGRSGCHMGRALKENGRGHLYAIDPHRMTSWNDFNSQDSYDIFRKNLQTCGVADHVSIIRADSTDAAKQWQLPIDLLFIDGDHSYAGVKRDWAEFSPFVTPFGVVVFHDTLWFRNQHDPWFRSDMGVPAFVDELRKLSYPVITLPRDCGVSIVQNVRGGIELFRDGAEEGALERGSAANDGGDAGVR